MEVLSLPARDFAPESFRILLLSPGGFFPTCMIVLRFPPPRGMLSPGKPAHGSPTCWLLPEWVLKSSQLETYILISETNSMKPECPGLIVKELNTSKIIVKELRWCSCSRISLWLAYGVLGNSSVSQFLPGTRENKVSCTSSIDVLSKWESMCELVCECEVS